MPIVHLRTYTLKTPNLAAAYAQRWKPTMASIAKAPYNIKTRGVYLSETNPKQVLAIIEFKDDDDPAAKIEAYAKSEAFQADLGEMEMSNFENVESTTLKPLDFVEG